MLRAEAAKTRDQLDELDFRKHAKTPRPSAKHAKKCAALLNLHFALHFRFYVLCAIPTAACTYYVVTESQACSNLHWLSDRGTAGRLLFVSVATMSGQSDDQQGAASAEPGYKSTNGL